MKKVRAKAYSQTTMLPAKADDGPWRWVVDNRMRDYGETNFERRVIRINKRLHRKNGELLIDTLFHEELHRMFPYLGERAVCAMTKLLLPTLSPRYRARLYARLRDQRAIGSVPHRLEPRAERDKENLGVYLLLAKEGMDDGGFQIEVVLDEAPASDVFKFQIQGAKDVDLFYQPEPTAEESPEGAVRTGQVAGSFAVHHETKTIHHVGGAAQRDGSAAQVHSPRAVFINHAQPAPMVMDRTKIAQIHRLRPRVMPP